jgi:hypothetical protein
MIHANMRRFFTSEQRCKIFENVFYFASFEKLQEATANPKMIEQVECPDTFQTLLGATAESIITIGVHRVSEDFIHSITNMLPLHDVESLRINPIIAEIALATLLQFSPAAITRKDREAILDRLSDIFSRQSAADDGEEHSEGLIACGINDANKNRVVTLMIRLLETSNSTAKMVCILRLWAVYSLT